MMIIDKTDIFEKWLRKLKDRRARAIIMNHIDRMEDGNMGKMESVGEGVYEKKIDYGPGYRLYLCQVNAQWILLLCGGDKSSQQRDIDHAKELKGKLKWTNN